MSSHKTSGIVLKGINFGEADKILTILTERFGKVKAIAKGVRKIRSHMGGSLEPFLLVDLELYEGKTFYIVTGVSIVKEFTIIHTDLRTTAKAFFLGELADRFLEENQKSPEIFNLFIQALESIESNEKDILIRAYELKIIEAAGFKPELYDCVHCKNKISAGQNYWDAIEGGVICGPCQNQFHHGREISDEVIKLFRFIEKNDLSRISLLKLNEKAEAEAEIILNQYIENILEREIKSRTFLRAVDERQE